MAVFESPDFHDKIVSARERPKNDGIQVIVDFTNGWGASVIRGPYTYGGPEGLYELAVLNPSGDIDYDNPVTPGDLIGWLTEEDVVSKLREISNLSDRWPKVSLIKRY